MSHHLLVEGVNAQWPHSYHGSIYDIISCCDRITFITLIGLKGKKICHLCLCWCQHAISLHSIETVQTLCQSFWASPLLWSTTVFGNIDERVAQLAELGWPCLDSRAYTHQPSPIFYTLKKYIYFRLVLLIPIVIGLHKSLFLFLSFFLIIYIDLLLFGVCAGAMGWGEAATSQLWYVHLNKMGQKK